MRRVPPSCHRGDLLAVPLIELHGSRARDMHVHSPLDTEATVGEEHPVLDLCEAGFLTSGVTPLLNECSTNTFTGSGGKSVFLHIRHASCCEKTPPGQPQRFQRRKGRGPVCILFCSRKRARGRLGGAHRGEARLLPQTVCASLVLGQRQQRFHPWIDSVPELSKVVPPPPTTWSWVVALTRWSKPLS